MGSHCLLHRGSQIIRTGSSVFGELAGPQSANVLDAVDGLGIHVPREFLVPKDGQSFLEGELEPVAARHAITRPIVKVLNG